MDSEQAQIDEEKFYDRFILGVKTVESGKACLAQKAIDADAAEHLIDLGLSQIEEYAEFRRKRKSTLATDESSNELPEIQQDAWPKGSPFRQGGESI